jgi:beta-lactamase class D
MPLTPQLWMGYSCIWYSQVLTSNLGMEKSQNYVDLFNYRNKDMSGGLTEAWMESSLKITPREQIFFLEKIINETLPVSAHSFAMTKKIVFLDEINDWKLYGKTGSGRHIHADGTVEQELGSGWFIGCLEHNDRSIAFVLNLRDEMKTEGFPGPRALQLLIPFIQ